MREENADMMLQEDIRYLIVMVLKTNVIYLLQPGQWISLIRTIRSCGLL